MRLINFINKKVIAVSGMFLSLMIGATAFAQTATAGAAATVEKVDMEPVYRSVIFYT
ncbi:MAG: cytochrome c oxidase subunit II, partial [Pedobacter sp.]